MNFEITDGDGLVQEEVWSCTECTWVSTKRHFRNGDQCSLCDSKAEKINTITQTSGMSRFRYKELLDHLEERADGVGSAIVENIESHFEDGDDFLDAVEAAYQEVNFSGLEEVNGVGEASAKQIAITISEEEGWDGGALFVMQ